MSTQYKFEQVSTIVSGKFDEIRSKCEKLGIGKEHILDLFLRSRIKKVTEEDDSLWGSISEINVKRNFFAMDEKVSEIISIMETFSPIQFLQEYEAYFYKEHNCTGMENGLAFERFLKLVKDCKVVIVDPNPYLVQKISNNNRLKNSRVTLAFTDTRWKQVYDSSPYLKDFSIKDFNKIVKLDKASHYAVLYFARRNKQKEIETHLSKLKELSAGAKSVSVMAVLPTSLLDPKKRTRSYRHILMEEWILKGVLLVDSKAIKSSSFKKHCIVLLDRLAKESWPGKTDSGLPYYRGNVTLWKVTLEKDDLESGNEGALYFVDQKNFKIPAATMYEERSSLFELYVKTCNENRSIKKRNSASVYHVSQEIELRYSGKVMDSGKIKPHIIFQGYIEKEKEINYKDEKKKLHVSLRTKTFQSEREMFEYVENLVIANEDLRNIIKQSVKNQYKSMSISLKTFWIINYEVISKKRNYSDAICRKMFHNPNGYDDPICRLYVGECSNDDVMDAVMHTSKKYGLTEAMENELIKQLGLLFSIAVD